LFRLISVTGDKDGRIELSSNSLATNGQVWVHLNVKHWRVQSIWIDFCRGKTHERKRNITYVAT